MHLSYQKWLLQHKLLHLFMWLLVWSTTFFTYYDTNLPLLPQVCNASMVILISLLPFYSTAYYFIPTFLYRRRYVLFLVLLLLLILSSGLLMMVSVRLVDHLFDPSTPIIPSTSAKLRFAFNLFTWTSLIAAFGAGGLKILSDRFKIEKRLSIVEKEKISTELNFLRSQVNPHFLFNLINTIYFQIDKKNTAARSSVEKLSEMLRYQLYECTSDTIDLFKELEYIKNYVSVQTLRMEVGSDIKLDISPGITNCKIAPLLILPLVENAFKHVSHFKNPALNKICIRLTRQDRQFVAIVTNTYDSHTTVRHLIHSGGLGVQNLQRRLELLYPDVYGLIVEKSNNIYQATLKVTCYD